MIRTRSSFDDQPGVDTLSELPLSIIHIILSLVPFKDAVRTSILSRNWRYKWTSFPNLVFNCKKLVSDSEECLKDFITHALSLHKGPIHKFEMSVLLQESCPNMGEWLLCLSRKDIKELIINTGYLDSDWSQRVHSCIYSCNKLTYLELQYCYVDPPPSTFKGFLFLRCLILFKVDLSLNAIESLVVANCPLLERFELTELKQSELRISAPNLKYLGLEGEFVEIYLHAPLLAKMSVHLINDNRFTQHQRKKSPFCNYTNFIGGLTNLKELKGEGFFTKMMSIGIESCHQPLVFHQLRVIKLSYVNFLDVKQISVLARLLIGAPNLHKLKISMDYFIGRDANDVSLNDFGFAPNFTLEKLRIVKVTIFKGLPLEKEFIQFLLENSPVLETMRIGHTRTLGTDEIQSLTDEFLVCSLASPTAKITIFSGLSFF